MDAHDLVAIHDISRLKYRYLRALDQKRWDEIETCFTEDATASYGGGAYAFESRDAILGFLRESMGSPRMLTSHRCSQPEIDLLGNDEATGTWALHDIVIHQDYDLTIAGAAFYVDRYRRLDDGWRISHTGYQRTFEEIFPRSSVQGLKVTADLWATDGRSTLPAGS